MAYVDGFVLPVPRKNLKTYWRMARGGRRMWLKAGALDYKECVGDDLNPKFGLSFRRMAKVKPGETVIFAYIVYRSRAHRDRVNARVMKLMDAGSMGMEMPFSVKRMGYGGFKVVVG